MRCLHPRYCPVVCIETCSSKELNLLQLATHRMAEASRIPPEIVRCEPINVHLTVVFLPRKRIRPFPRVMGSVYPMAN